MLAHLTPALEMRAPVCAGARCGTGSFPGMVNIYALFRPGM